MTRRKAQAVRKPPPKRSKSGRPAATRAGTSARRPGPAARRGRNPIAIGAIVVVLALVGAMVAFALVRKPSAPAPSGPGAAAARTLQAVPDSVLSKVGLETSVNPPTRLRSGVPALTQDGKPEVLYIGAEYCPFCAAERWPLILALSRFGHFSGLSATRSSSNDIHPDTATFSFHGATYTSSVLSFTGIEEETNVPNGSGGYTRLDTPSAAEQALLQRYDAAPYTDQAGAIPFVMYGNAFVSIGASYDTSELAGLTVDQIAARLANPDDPLTKAVVGAANTIVAGLCELTGGQPTDVCSAPWVAQIQAAIPAAP